MKKFWFSLLFSISLLCQYSYTQDKKDPSRWTPEDIINTEYMRSVSFSPDGSMLVWTKRRGHKEKDKFLSDIYLTRLDIMKDNKPLTTQLTHRDENDRSPLFSKDGEYIYFLSSRDKGKKLWKLSIYGGEPEEVNEFENGISNIKWLDAQTLLFVSNEGKTLYEKTLEDKKDNVVVVEDSLHWKTSRVFSYHLKTKSIQRVTENEKPVGSYSVSKNGEWLVYSMVQSRHYPADAQPDPLYFLKNLKTGQTTQILKELLFPSGNFQFTADNGGFYFTSSYASDPQWNGAGIEELYYFDLSKMQYQKLDLQWELGVGAGFQVIGNDVIANLANKARYLLAYYKKGKNQSWNKLPFDLGAKTEHTFILDVSENNDRIAYQYSTASKMPEYFTARIKSNKISDEKEIIQLNKNLSKKPITKSEVITWKGYKDEEVTGILYYPENYKPGQRYPLVLSIHGGPASQDTDTWSERWSTYPNLLSQKGAFVLKPNYHGSANHGLAYVESIKGNYYEPELEDITKAIAMLDEKGMIDKEKMGAMGWSNGAILTTMLTVRYPEMFKVAAAGAGDVNWTSDFGTCRFGVSFDQSYFGGAPWDDMNGTFYNENYIIKSPLFEMEKVKTPTIIFHGSEDRAVPRDQGWEYYRALQQVGEAPVRFLWFPGQPHGLLKITHQLRKMKEEIEWINTYLFEKPTQKNEAFKESSPLAELLKRQENASKNGFYGTEYNEKLIPETVLLKKDSIALGRFEVTHEQYKQYKNAHSYLPGHGNYPVEVSYEEAIGYVSWLSQLTGKTYRLPSAGEADKLHKKALKAAPSENTLKYWAGYDITKDDIAEFSQKLKEVKETLLLPVGHFKAVKVEEAELYDLGGNLAELDADGNTYGFSAYDYADTKKQKRTNLKRTGFRVVKE
ncbi:prolyl oligopeptidase family serine peptidase [Ascidiimonas aurantiaca]|uniref:S9 family peptidase n=1 Tax=Ascidiimonas aurantiaca TaxID=1685432 RepID=UPI0030EEEBA3